MQINLTARHMDLTDSLRNYVDTKMRKIKRHFDRVTQIHVIIGVEKDRQSAEANFHISGHDIFAKTENSDMYAAIDELVDKLDRQLLKHKQKMQSHR